MKSKNVQRPIRVVKRTKCYAQPKFDAGAGLCPGDPYRELGVDEEDCDIPCECDLPRGHGGPHCCDCCGRKWLEDACEFLEWRALV